MQTSSSDHPWKVLRAALLLMMPPNPRVRSDQGPETGLGEGVTCKLFPGRYHARHGLSPGGERLHSGQ